MARIVPSASSASRGPPPPPARPPAGAVPPLARGCRMPAMFLWRDLGFKIVTAFLLCVAIAGISELYFGARDGFVVAFDVAVIGVVIISMIEGAHRVPGRRWARHRVTDNRYSHR